MALATAARVQSKCTVVDPISETVTAISSEWWRVGGRSPQPGPGAEPLVRGSEGHSPPEAEKKLNFDNTKPLLILHLSKHFGVSQRSV